MLARKQRRSYFKQGIAIALVGLVAVVFALVLVSRSSVAGSPAHSDACPGPITLETGAPETSYLQHPQPAYPPGTIDGAKDPELIPDDVAYRLLFLAVAEPDHPTPEQSARARAKLRAAQLSEDDLKNIILAIASDYKRARDALDAQAQNLQLQFPLAHLNPRSVEGHELAQLAKKRDQLALDAVASLQNRLSSEGFRSLKRHIETVKRHIKLIPSPDMPF
jgi:hypothetical protein